MKINCYYKVIKTENSSLKDVVLAQFQTIMVMSESSPFYMLVSPFGFSMTHFTIPLLVNVS